MNTNERLQRLLKERGWSMYRLSLQSGLSQATLANIFRRNTLPSIATLEAICKGFGITLAQFFAEGEMVEMTPDLKGLFDCWVCLTVEQKTDYAFSFSPIVGLLEESTPPSKRNRLSIGIFLRRMSDRLWPSTIGRSTTLP